VGDKFERAAGDPTPRNKPQPGAPGRPSSCATLCLVTHAKRKKRPKKPAATQISWFRRAGGNIVWLLSLLAALTGLYYVRPKMTITPIAIINPSDPFSTAFEVANVSEFLPFQDIRAGCDGTVTYTVMGSSGGEPVTPKFSVGVESRDELSPGKSYSTACNIKFDVGGVPLKVSELAITMKSAYSIPFMPPSLALSEVF
jgi:hypothetical protein